MKTLERKFTEKELNLIACLISHHGGQLADDNEKYIGSKEWKDLWALYDYFNQLANEE